MQKLPWSTGIIISMYYIKKTLPVETRVPVLKVWISKAWKGRERKGKDWQYIWLHQWLQPKLTFLPHKVFNGLPFHVIRNIADEHPIPALTLFLPRALLFSIRMESVSLSISRFLFKRGFLFFCVVIVPARKTHWHYIYMRVLSAQQ